ncbi:MAG: toll/interleukin-1 receptor domain-containing protein [Methylococcales bacterium]
MAHDVFISHSSKDKVCADALCATLEKHNVRCWVAPRDILPGSDYGSAILEGIKASKVMILIFSSNSNESAHVKREVERAVNHGIIIVPFKIEDVALSSTMEYFVSGTHWLDAIDPPFENHLKSVTEHMCLLLNKPVPIWEQATNTGSPELPLILSQIAPISVDLTEEVLVSDAPVSMSLTKAVRLKKDRLKKDQLETISEPNSFLIYSLSDLESEIQKYKNIDTILAPIKLEIEKLDASTKNKQDIEKPISDIRNVFSNVKFLLKNIDNLFDKIKKEDLNDIEIEIWVNKLNQSSDIYLAESVNAIVSCHDELSSILSNVNDFLEVKSNHLKKEKLVKKEKLEKEILRKRRLEKERLKKEMLQK